MRTKEIIRNTNFYFPLFFLFLFFYYLLVFDSSLYYHYHQPIFLFYKIYLKEFLLYPGGLAELTTQFFLQFFCFNLPGAFLLSALSISVFIIIYRFIKKIGVFKYSLVLSFLPVCFLLIAQNHYNFPLVITFKYLLALIFFLSYVKIPKRYKTLIIILSFLIYYLLGGWVYLLYIALCALHELLFSKNRGKYIYAVLNSLVYFIYPYIAARFLFMISLKEAYLYIAPLSLYTWPFNFNLNLYCYLFSFSLPALQIALFVYLKYIKGKVRKQNILPAGFHRIPAQSVFIILVAVLTLTLSFDRREKKNIQIDYLAEQGRWNELLNISREMEEYNTLIIFNVIRALYHTGQLLDDLFFYPQIKGADVLFLENFPRPVAIQVSDLYFDLGHIKAAQVMAYEGHTRFGYNPRILTRIVVTNIINEKYVVAKKFLDILNKSILHKKWVKNFRNYLGNEILIKSDSLIQSKRKLLPHSDFFIAVNKHSYIDLIRLLKENENNKMAFEYLMAYYLLAYKLDDLEEHLDMFKRLGYRKYPRHIEEALLLIRVIDPSKNVALDYSVNPYTIKQFDQFNILLSKCENEATAEKALRKEFYNTYWYYVRYIYPMIKKREEGR